jgi:hypothetical protein
LPAAERLFLLFPHSPAFMKPVTDPIPAALQRHQLLAAGALGVLSWLVVFMAAGAWVVTCRQGFTGFAVLPLLFLPVVAMAARHWQQLTTQISARAPRPGCSDPLGPRA